MDHCQWYNDSSEYFTSYIWRNIKHGPLSDGDRRAVRVTLFCVIDKYIGSIKFSNESIPEIWPSILNNQFGIENFNLNGKSRETRLIKMGKISEILLNSLFITSAYANNFAVPSCNDDSLVSFTLITMETMVYKLSIMDMKCLKLVLVRSGPLILIIYYRL